jgi:prophage maintenance system killer protein
MPSKLDLFLTISINKKLTIKEIITKIPSSSYLSIYNYLKQLEKENLIKKNKIYYFLSNNRKSKELFSLVYFCFKNNLDYNNIVLENISKYILTGYENKYLDVSLYNNKTINKYNKYLLNAGLIYIESKKPLKVILIPSNFTDLLIKYFLDITKYKEFNYDIENIDLKLEREFSKFRKKQKTIISDQIKFVYTSLSLEGITLTLPQTEKLLKENISPNIPLYKDIQQTTDYKKAIDFLIKNKLNLENILVFHGIAMNSLDFGMGEVRKQNVKIKGNPNFKTPDYKDLPLLLNNFENKLIDFFSKKQKISKIIENASYLHNEFQRIHPFIDGNSRTSRAIFSIYLVKNNFPLINIPVGYFDLYMKQTKMSTIRNDFEFSKLMKLIVLKNLEERKF